MPHRVLVTGGAGFIGSAVVRYLLERENEILTVDNLTYAGNLKSLSVTGHESSLTFVQADICDQSKMDEILNTFKPDWIMHLAAESHVDRSIDTPQRQPDATGKPFQSKQSRRFGSFTYPQMKSTDRRDNEYFNESTPYDPSSPYAASKAAADHLVRSSHRTYGLPVIVTNCCNNYGPFQFPEKLIPLTIVNLIQGKEVPVYGTGTQIRDWLFVDDHARALYTILMHGRVGETYAIGGHSDRLNIDTVKTICSLMAQLSPSNKPYKRLISFVADRPGHDKRYAIDASKLKNELDWKPECSMLESLEKTVQWYLGNRGWWEPLLGRAANVDHGTLQTPQASMHQRVFVMTEARISAIDLKEQSEQSPRDSVLVE